MNWKSRKLLRGRTTPSLPTTHDASEVQGPRGSHLYFLANLLNSDVSSFRSAPSKALRPYIVKNVISQVLEALVQLHSLDIIHTGVSEILKLQRFTYSTRLTCDL